MRLSFPFLLPLSVSRLPSWEATLAVTAVLPLPTSRPVTLSKKFPRNSCRGHSRTTDAQPGMEETRAASIITNNNNNADHATHTLRECSWTSWFN